MSKTQAWWMMSLTLFFVYLVLVVNVTHVFEKFTLGALSTIWRRTPTILCAESSSAWVLLGSWSAFSPPESRKRVQNQTRTEFFEPESARQRHSVTSSPSRTRASLFVVKDSSSCRSSAAWWLFSGTRPPRLPVSFCCYTEVHCLCVFGYNPSPCKCGFSSPRLLLGLSRTP